MNLRIELFCAALLLLVGVGMGQTSAHRATPAVPGAARPAPTAAKALPPWRPDLERAMAEARERRLPLLVCLNMDCDPGNDRMARAVYRDGRVVAAMDGVVPVLASPSEHGQGGACTRFDHLCCAQHQACEREARRLVFGNLCETIAPQHIILHPDGGVLWHELYEIDARTLVRGIELSVVACKQKPAQRLARNEERLLQLTRGACERREFDQARTLLAQAGDEHFPRLVAAIRNHDLTARLLLGLACAYPARALQLLPLVDTRGDQALRSRIEAALGKAANLARAQTAPDATPDAAPALALPLPVLGTATRLHEVVFTDGIKRELSRDEGEFTLLWFFRADDPLIAQQVAQINRVAREVSGRGVTVLGLAASLDPEQDAPALGRLGLAFPAGAYRYDQASPRDGIRWFPSTLVLDRQAQILHRTQQEPGVPDRFEAVLRAVMGLQGGSRPWR